MIRRRKVKSKAKAIINYPVRRKATADEKKRFWREKRRPKKDEVK